VAGSGGQHTSPDLTAAHWQQGQPGDYGQYGTGPGGGRRPWWRSPFALVAAVVVLLGGGGAAYFVANGSNNKDNNKPPVVPVTGLKVPGCSTAAAAASKLHVKAPRVSVPTTGGDPFGTVTSPDGKAVFVVTDTYLQVFKTGPGGSLASTPSWQYPIGNNPGVATNIVRTSDGKYLLVAANNGIQVLDAAGAENGASSINVGQLTVPGFSKDERPIGVAVTPDGKFAFVSLQFANVVGVFDLAKALSTHDFTSDYLGSLNVGTQPVGLTVSPDGKTLYATNFVQDAPVPGKLTIIDVAKATTKGQQSAAVVSQAQAGCHPARIIVTPDGKTIWVTARQSNVLLGYSSSLLRTSPGKALIAKVQVGQWPIGIALVDGGKRIVITDNDNLQAPQQQTAHNVAVVDPAAALKGKTALLGYINSGLQPRDIAVSPDGRYLYITDRGSSQVQTISVSALP